MHTVAASPNDTTRVIQFDARPILSQGAGHTRFTRVDISAEHTVAQVLARHAPTRATISRLGLDTCCGANLSLQQASDSRGIVLESMLLELNTEAVR